MNGHIRAISAELLARYIQARMPPSLGVIVRSQHADYEDALPEPSVVVLPLSMQFQPFPVSYEDETLQDKVLVDLGVWEGATEIRILCNSKAQREVVEEAVVGILMGQDELAPGVLTLQTPPVKIGGAQFSARAACSWAINTVEFRDELAFDSQRYSFVQLETTLPALAMRTGVYTITSLEVTFEEGVEVDLEAAPGSTETFAVDESGTLTPA